MYSRSAPLEGLDGHIAGEPSFQRKLDRYILVFDFIALYICCNFTFRNVIYIFIGTTYKLLRMQFFLNQNNM